MNYEMKVLFNLPNAISGVIEIGKKIIDFAWIKETSELHLSAEIGTETRSSIRSRLLEM